MTALDPALNRARSAAARKGARTRRTLGARRLAGDPADHALYGPAGTHRGSAPVDGDPVKLIRAILDRLKAGSDSAAVSRETE